jgi:hypothetical protein
MGIAALGIDRTWRSLVWSWCSNRSLSLRSKVQGLKKAFGRRTQNVMHNTPFFGMTVLTFITDSRRCPSCLIEREKEQSQHDLYDYDFKPKG